MLKIGIVTFHRAYNYGVCLQAFATLTFLNEQGYETEIIDYTNLYEQRIQKWSYKENNKVTGYITSFAKNLLLGKAHYFKKGFGTVDKLYTLSKRRYNNINEMSDLKYDVLVAGSDQIWNETITDGIDDVFLLRFGNAKKRISIASSLGSTRPSQEAMKQFEKALKRFSAISVREEFGKNILQPVANKNIKVLMDPTFLLTREQWISKLGCESQYLNKKEKYILTYFVGENKAEYRKTVAQYAQLMGCPVWAIQYTNYSWKVNDKKILGATLEDFIALFAGAQLILTDSFHGTAFSINLAKNFVAFKHKTNPVRVMALLEKLGLSERLNMMPQEYKDISYSNVNPRLEELRNDSREWIIGAIEAN